MPVPSRADGPEPHPRAGLKRRTALLALALATLLSLCMDIASGPSGMDLSTLWNVLVRPDEADPAARAIVWQLRLPQAVMAVLVGGSLGLAGAEMQTALDNPLASPFTLGISSAAALGAAAALILDLRVPFLPGQYTVVGFAFLFALGCALALDAVARRAGIGQTGIVLCGIALVFGFNALLSLIQLAANPSSLQDLLFWMMGSLARADWPRVGAQAAVLAVALPFSLWDVWRMTALRFGDDRAVSFGVDVARVRRHALLRVSALAAVAVSLVGVIGFIGLVVPHMARRLWGEDHRWYLPASMWLGGLVLSLASVLAKALPVSAGVPVGVVTTLVGLPLFLLILLRPQGTWR